MLYCVFAQSIFYVDFPHTSSSTPILYLIHRILYKNSRFLFLIAASPFRSQFLKSPRTELLLFSCEVYCALFHLLFPLTGFFPPTAHLGAARVFLSHFASLYRYFLIPHFARPRTTFPFFSLPTLSVTSCRRQFCIVLSLVLIGLSPFGLISWSVTVQD